MYYTPLMYLHYISYTPLQFNVTDWPASPLRNSQWKQVNNLRQCNWTIHSNPRHQINEQFPAKQ